MDRSRQGAMMLPFDVDPLLQNEHDDWHSHEHLLEQSGSPGLRARLTPTRLAKATSATTLVPCH